MRIINKKRCKQINDFLEKIPGNIFCWTVLMLVGICYFVAPTILSYIDVDIIQKFLNTVKNFKDNNISLDIIIKTAVVALAVMVIMKITIECLLKYKYSCRKLRLIEHTSLNQMAISIDSSLEDNYEIEPISINLVSEMEAGEISYAVRKQDSEVVNFKNYLRTENVKEEYGYSGIVHTPLIYRMGYQLGDETRFDLLHKWRNEGTFKILESKGIRYAIDSQEEKVVTGSNKLLVAVSTTTDIIDTDLVDFDLNTMNFIKFKSTDLGFDVVDSKDKVDGYAYSIMKYIEDKVKEWRITEVHMVISSSVALTFALGQATRENCVPNLIVYNYKDGRYPWGIKIYEMNTTCLVKGDD